MSFLSKTVFHGDVRHPGPVADMTAEIPYEQVNTLIVSDTCDTYFELSNKTEQLNRTQ